MNTKIKIICSFKIEIPVYLHLLLLSSQWSRPGVSLGAPGQVCSHGKELFSHEEGSMAFTGSWGV